MSLDLNEYFNLGLESTNNPIENAGMQNIFRTPVDTSSANLNRITFKFPKTGLLTADSMITLQFVLSDASGAASTFTPNLVNGAVGAIKRTRILVDNKVLVDLERPGLAENVKLYSRNTQVELAEKQYKLMGNQFRTTVHADGTEAFDVGDTRIHQNTAGSATTISKNIILQEATSKVYGIPLKHLGADFLEAASLPVFLLGHREMILELEFFSDCREYVVAPADGAVAAGDVKINLANAELVSTHIALPNDLEASEIANLKTRPAQYPLKDKYVIKGVCDATVGVNTAIPLNYRINFQNREVHNLMICSVITGANIAGKRITANQFSMSMGDETLQMKVNGLNLFDRPIVTQPMIYQLTTYSEDGMTLKVPYNAWSVTDQSLRAYEQSTNSLYLDYRGGFHYTKVDFSNANSGVFGSGTMMKTACEVEHTITPRTATNPNQTQINDVFFYATISKLMTIGSSQVNISY